MFLRQADWYHPLPNCHSHEWQLTLPVEFLVFLVRVTCAYRQQGLWAPHRFPSMVVQTPPTHVSELLEHLQICTGMWQSGKGWDTQLILAVVTKSPSDS